MSLNNKILLVEDDQSISEMVKGQLMKEGYRVVTAFDGEEAIHHFFKESFDLVLLDLMLPKMDGMDFMKIIRGQSSIPILIMSAKDDDLNKALGLGFGADDYITKPFSMIELIARVKAAIRRATDYSKVREDNSVNKLLKIGHLTIDVANFSVFKNDVEIKLTSKEFQILKMFITRPNQVFTKAQLYQSIWNDDYLGDENIINVHIRRLREKIENDPSSPQYIKTLWGIGYKLGEF